MRRIHFLISFLCLSFSLPVAAQTLSVTVPAGNAAGRSFHVERIPLSSYAMPAVHLGDVKTTAAEALPQGVTPGVFEDGGLDVRLGMEKGRPFAAVAIPLYAEDAKNPRSLRRLESFTLEVTQAPAAVVTAQTASRTTGASSVLASGSWQKISVNAAGIYKIDFDFIKNKLGKDPAGINPGHIRLFGNGGALLSEKNSVARPDDLQEVAISVSDGGDNAFNTGDYFLFYAAGPTSWEKDSVSQRFFHRTHLYDDSSYYFISFDNGPGLRIASGGAAPAPNVTVTDYNDRAVREEEKYNPGKFGKDWYGDELSPSSSGVLTRNIAFDGPAVTADVRARVRLGVRAPQSGNIIKMSYNNAVISSEQFGSVPMTLDDTPLQLSYKEYTLSGTPNFTFDFSTPTLDGRGYIDYVEINTRRQLALSGSQLLFRDWRSVGAGKVAGFQIGNGSPAVQVWDITSAGQPVQMSTSLSGSVVSFARAADALHEYVAFNGAQFLTPGAAGAVPNQNLHGTDDVDYIIVAHPAFMSAANELAAHHRTRNGYRVVVASTKQIYNEFSSGSQDISAIRDFARMFYKRAGTDTTRMPRYILLFGDASYDYKDRTAGNTNFVPTFEASESSNHAASYCVDDFFAFLDDNEEMENTTIANTLDAGVGRLPVRTPEDAAAAVAKVKMYQSAAALGPWRLNNTYVADNEDGAGPHLGDAEGMEQIVNARASVFNSDKVYLDNYNFIATPAGFRAPDANKSINDDIFRGTALINYSGHGGPAVLAHERILTADDFNSWTNSTKMPLMITATCDFSRFDQPTFVSAGEKLVTKAKGGAIALVTTTQLVYADANRPLNEDFLAAQYTRNGNRWNTFGDAFRLAKNESYSQPNSPNLLNYRAFSLLADPALPPAFPEHRVRTTGIIEDGSGQPNDTIKALGAYTVSGEVTNEGGNLLGDFNGRVYVTVFEKPRKISLYTKETNAFREYRMQDNILYKGTATVSAGQFTFTFIAPKDLDIEYGAGRISYYAENGVTDAAGADTTRKVGGLSSFPVQDDDPPLVRAFMNDSTFRNGALTGSNTLLYVLLSDKTGINVTGSSVGHDVVGVLDGDIAHPFILNDYYETFPNTYQRGFVRFPLTGLPDGRHTITVKAWDVVNNSGEGSVDFVVGNKGVFQVQNLMNYPNPFSNETHFVFEHNHPGEAMNAKIAIYRTDGTLVKMIDENFTPDASRSREIVWDGTATNGARLPSGVYPYRIMLSTEKGLQASAYQKIVIVR